MFSLCLLTLFFPFTYTSYTFAKQGKQFWHMVTYDRFGCRSCVVQMSFRMSFKSRGISKRQIYCQDADLREWQLNNVLFSTFVLLIAVSKKGDLGNPCGAESAYTSTLPTPLPPLPEPFEGSFRFQNFIDMIWMSFRCRSGCRSPPTIPPKHLKPRIRCGDAANYEPRITQDIAKYRVFLAAHYWSTPLKNMEVKWGY